jgi:hypothetical protein
MRCTASLTGHRYTCMHTLIYIYIYIYIHTHTHTHIHADRLCIHTYTYTQADCVDMWVHYALFICVQVQVWHPSFRPVLHYQSFFTFSALRQLFWPYRLWRWCIYCAKNQKRLLEKRLNLFSRHVNKQLLCYSRSKTECAHACCMGILRVQCWPAGWWHVGIATDRSTQSW